MRVIVWWALCLGLVGLTACGPAGGSGLCATVTCAAADQCHEVGTCDPSTGVCSTPVKVDGSACNDGNACTQFDTCQAGTCTGASPVTCTAVDQCHDVGTCEPSAGACSTPVKPDGSACSDGNACTQLDTCQAGTCTGANPVTCSAVDQCHDLGTCEPSTGLCSTPSKADGSACSDGNACTQSDTCQAGTCTGASPVTCTAVDQCHDVGTCAPSTGLCSTPVKNDGSACSDGNLCTQLDTCQAGTCTGASPVTCTALNACYSVGTCEPGTGLCSTPAAPVDAGTLDQMQLDRAGSIGLSATQIPGQTWTVGRSGVLTGVEVRLGPCNGADTAGQVKLEVFDSADVSLGSATISEASLPNVCGGGTALTSSSIGPGYFDLSGQCLPVTAGQQLRFMLTLIPSGPEPTCNPTTYRCSNNGRFCFSSSECSGFYYVGLTNCGGGGCSGSGLDYTGGTEVVITNGSLRAESAFDLNFKTFVQ